MKHGVVNSNELGGDWSAAAHLGGPCWICKDPADHDGVPHSEAHKDGLTREAVVTARRLLLDGNTHYLAAEDQARAIALALGPLVRKQLVSELAEFVSLNPTLRKAMEDSLEGVPE